MVLLAFVLLPGLAFGVGAATAGAQERAAPDPPPIVSVTGPSVIAFWQVPASDSVLDADPGLASALDDQQYYWAGSRAPLEAAGIAALDQPGRTFRLREPGRSWLFAADPDSSEIGYLVVRPGYRPRVLYRRHFVDELLAAMRGLVPAPEPGSESLSTVDRGIGVVSLRSEFDGGPRAALESLTVRSRPDAAAVSSAALVRREEGPGRGWSYAVAGIDDLVPALLEFDYEIQGLAIDRIAPDGDWAHVLLGHDGSGRPRAGWVALDTGRVGMLLWREHLPQREWLFFTADVPPPLFDGPGGRALGADTVFAADGGYSLYAEEVRGDWMRVRIVSPDDSCGSAVRSPRVTRAWVRYIDDGGRPRVWYHTRGC
ncbi:MAG: hypothetical protein ACYC2G_01195 [Gemmatimonadaceae bacterium]